MWTFYETIKHLSSLQAARWQATIEIHWVPWGCHPSRVVVECLLIQPSCNKGTWHYACTIAEPYIYHCAAELYLELEALLANTKQQGKSEGFESCDWPIVRKRPIWVKIGDVLYRVTLKFDVWPWKTIGHLSFAVSSFVQHFIAISEFKLGLQSGNAHFGSNSTIFRAVWPWNLTDDLEKQ